VDNLGGAWQLLLYAFPIVLSTLYANWQDGWLEYWRAFASLVRKGDHLFFLCGVKLLS
jgi:hypothetical protein